MSGHRIPLAELARLLSCSNDQVHATADRLGIPHDERETVRADGSTRRYRVYLRAEVMAALDERGRASARKAVS